MCNLTLTNTHIRTLVTTLNGVKSVAPCELLVTLTTRYSSGMIEEFLGLGFLKGELERSLDRIVDGEIPDFFIDLGDWELEMFLECE